MSDRGPGVRLPPPLVFGGFVALGFTLDAVAGFSWPETRWTLPIGLIGYPLILAGVAAIAAALLRFRPDRTAPEPWKPSSALAERGIYRFTRNPMYLGMALVQLGIGLAAGSPGVLLMLVPALWSISRFVIAREEAYLAARFGAAYEAYRRRVRRWL